MGDAKWACHNEAWAWVVLVILAASLPAHTKAWIPFIGEETHKHLDLLSHHKEWDVLKLLNINGSQTGVSEARGPIPGMKAWRLRAVFDNIHLDQAVVEEMRTHLKNELSIYFVFKQHKKTIGSLLSVNMPGKIKPWFQVISNLKTRRLNVFYHIKEDTKTHQISFQLPEKVGWTWTRLLLTINGTQARVWTNCGDYDKQKLAGHVDLHIPEGGLLYFRQEPGLKNKLIGSLQMAKIFNFSTDDRLWLCHFDDQFGPASDEAECEAIVNELDSAYDIIDVMKIKEEELVLTQEEERLKMIREMDDLRQEMDNLVNGFGERGRWEGTGLKNPVSERNTWRREEGLKAEEDDRKETLMNSESSATGECRCETTAGNVCRHNGQIYERSQLWKPDTCTICRCEEGQVTCDRNAVNCRDPCEEHPCAQGSSCVPHPGHLGFRCLCPSWARGPRCQHLAFPCSPLEGGPSQDPLRQCHNASLQYQYQPITMQCQETIVCRGDLGYRSLAECENRCLSGICCFQNTSANLTTCQAMTLKACKTLHERNDVIVSSYTPGSNQELGFTTREQNEDITDEDVDVEGNSDVGGRHCGSEASRVRREVRRTPRLLIRQYLRGFDRLIQDGTMTSLTTDYGRSIMLANSQEAWLEWQRALLDEVEGALRRTSRECQLTIPFWDFTTHAKDVTASPIFNSNYLGGGSNREEEEEEDEEEKDETWRTFIKRDVRTDAPAASVVELARILQGTEATYVRSGLWQEQTRVMAALGGTAISYDSILDPVLLSLFAFVDKVWRGWQEKFPASPPEYASGLHLDPLRVTQADVWFPNSSRVVYEEPKWVSECSSHSTNEDEATAKHGETNDNFNLHDSRNTTDEQREQKEQKTEEISEDDLPALTSSLLNLFTGLPTELLHLIEANNKCVSDDVSSLNPIESEMDARLEKWRAIVWREKTEKLKRTRSDTGVTSAWKNLFTRRLQIKGTTSLCFNPDTTNWRQCAGPCQSSQIPAECFSDATIDNITNACPAFPRAQPRINVCGPSCGLEWTVQGKLVNCIKRDPCQPNPCAHGGECKALPSPLNPQGFECHCSPEFEGSTCQRARRSSCYLPVDRGFCPSSASSGKNVRPVLHRWYYDPTRGECRVFAYMGCGGNGNNYISHSACVDACNVGNCCFRTKRNWGAKLLQKEQEELEADKRAAADEVWTRTPYGQALRGLVSIFSSMSSSRTSEETARVRFNDDGRDEDGYDCWGRDRWGRDRKRRLGGWNPLECRWLRRTECVRTKDAPDQFQVVSFTPRALEMHSGIPLDLAARGRRRQQHWKDVKGERCGCFFFGDQYEVGEMVDHPCLQLRCQPGGGIVFGYHPLATQSLISPTHRREVRDLTPEDIRIFQGAVAKLADGQAIFNWKNLTDMYARYLPHFAGSDYFLPWHRYLLRLVEAKMMSEAGCQFSIPYFDWTIDIGDMAKSIVWQANYFGGQGEGQSLCVKRHPFMSSPTSVFKVDCLRRNFNQDVSLPDAVNVAYLMTIKDYREFRMQLETMSGLFQLFVGGHMATPERLYDPIFLCHAAFVDKLWQDWQERRSRESYEQHYKVSEVGGDLEGSDKTLLNWKDRSHEDGKKERTESNSEDESKDDRKTGSSGGKPDTTKDDASETHKIKEGKKSDFGRRETLNLFPRQLRFEHMEPLGVSPDDVLDSPSKMKVLYLPVSKGSPCLFPVREGEEEPRENTTKAYDHEGYDAQGYSKFGFDSIGYDREGYDINGYSRDGFTREGFSKEGYDRYGLKPDGCTSFGPPLCKGTFNLSEASPLPKKFFDTFGYTQQGFDIMGLDRRGFDAFGFTLQGYDQNNCNFYNHGPFYALWKAKLEDQLEVIDDPGKFLNIKRACPAVSLVPVWWLQNNYFSPEHVQSLRKHEKTHHSLRPVLPLTDPSSTKGPPLMSPQKRLCLHFDPYSLCPLGSRQVDCRDEEERLCQDAQCLGHPDSICRVQGCNGTCAVEFYNGATGKKVDCQGCQYSGRVVAEGAVVPGRGVCEECKCVAGSILCTHLECPTLNCSVEHIIRHPRTCCGDCVECEGRPENEIWQPNPCVLCKCQGNVPKCHAFECPPAECQHPLTPEGDCCPECHHCSYEGQELRHGQQLKLSNCWTCTCHSGTVNCSHEVCPPPNCPAPFEVEGECCPICPGECRYDQRTFPDGATFTPSYNPCLNCSCLEGRVRCSPVTCSSLPCPRDTARPGDCCPAVCPTGFLSETESEVPVTSEKDDDDDDVGGSTGGGSDDVSDRSHLDIHRSKPCIDEEDRTHHHGGRWLYPADPCQICECHNGEAKCHKDHSQCPLQCQHGIVPHGQCCPACRDCFFQGQVVSEGSWVVQGSDPCTMCQCQAGTMHCSTKQCPLLRCQRVEHPSGECCPKCGGCTDGTGTRREHGNSWISSEDPCQACRCHEGIIRCGRRQCQQAKCSHPVPPSSSECCPQCGGGCLYDGRLYPHLHKTPARDPCTTCTCFEGNVECETIRCSDVYCEDPEIPRGECCPVCNACVYLGTIYSSGEVFTPATAPCMECTCTGGQVHCVSQEHLCNPQCRHPATPPSQCCPMCDDCLFQNEVYKNGEEFPIPDSDAEKEKDPCTVCQCLHGEVRCVSLSCHEVECSNTKTELKECCSSCLSLPPTPSPATITTTTTTTTTTTMMTTTTTTTSPLPTTSPPTCRSLRGLQRQEGETWVDEENHCRICKCHEEETVCFPRPCPLVVCPHPDIPDDACCPECHDCFYTLMHFQSGQDFVHRQDPCQECQCQNGTVTCRTKICPLLACEEPIHIPGNCCPHCPLTRHCTHMNVTHDHGTVFPDPQDECQECECHEARVTCYPRQCPPYACPNPAQRTCCSDCQGCSYAGRNLEDNTTFSDPADPCRTCDCRKGHVTCRTEQCPASSSSCLHPVHLPDTCCPICKECEHGNEMYEDGMTFASKEDLCLECHCDYPEVKCFPKYCPPTLCAYPTLDADGCCRSCDRCLFEGKEYYNGQHFLDPTDQCSQCSCRMGNIQCTRIPCETRTSCPYPVPGICCPECGSGCHYHNQTLPDGATFPDELVPCQECLCHGGYVTCASKRCQSVPCTHPITEECCPSCSGCLMDSRIIENGLQFAHPSQECQVCECQDGSVKCQLVQCPEVDCPHPSIVNCCPTCEDGCRVGDLRLRDGMIHHPRDRPCHQCVCRGGHLDCERRSCPVLTCPELVSGECCPRCANDSGCVFYGEIYQHEGTFTDLFSCQDCLCLSGVVHCVPVDCPSLTCANQITSPDDCCPICRPYCVHGGVMYPSGITFRHLDHHCKSCTCVEGETVCRDLECPPPLCTHPRVPRIPTSSTDMQEVEDVNEVSDLTTPAIESESNSTAIDDEMDDQCCPSCSGCSYKGNDYENGQKFSSSCDSCICQLGSVTCGPRSCPPVSCLHPVQPRGSCCPSCPGCVFQGHLLPVGYKFIHPEEPCSLCHCQPDEEVTCSQLPCPTNICSSDQVLSPPSAGKCCPVCSTKPLRNLEKGKDAGYEMNEDNKDNIPHHIFGKDEIKGTGRTETERRDFEKERLGSEHIYVSQSPKNMGEHRVPVEAGNQNELDKVVVASTVGTLIDSEDNQEDLGGKDEFEESRGYGTLDNKRDEEGKKEAKNEDEQALLSALEDSNQVFYIFDGDKFKLIKGQLPESDTTDRVKNKDTDISSQEMVDKDVDINVPGKVPGKSKLKFKVKLRVSKVPGKTTSEDENEEDVSPDTSFLQEVPLIVKNFKPVIFKPGCDKNKTNKTVSKEGNDYGDDNDDEDDSNKNADHTGRNTTKNDIEKEATNKDLINVLEGLILEADGRQRFSPGTDTQTSGDHVSEALSPGIENEIPGSIDTLGHDKHTYPIPALQKKKSDDAEVASPWFSQSRASLTYQKGTSRVPDATPSQQPPESSPVLTHSLVNLVAAPEQYVVKENASQAYAPRPSSITPHSTSEVEEEAELPRTPPAIHDQFSTSSSIFSQVHSLPEILTNKSTSPQSVRSSPSSTSYGYFSRYPIATVVAPTPMSSENIDDTSSLKRTHGIIDDKDEDKVEKEMSRIASEIKKEGKQPVLKEKTKEQEAEKSYRNKMKVELTEETDHTISGKESKERKEPFSMVLEGETSQRPAEVAAGGKAMESLANDMTSSNLVRLPSAPSETRTHFFTPTPTVADFTNPVPEAETTARTTSATKGMAAFAKEIKSKSEAVAETEFRDDAATFISITTTPATLNSTENREAASNHYIHPTTTTDIMTNVAQATTPITTVPDASYRESVIPSQNSYSQHISSYSSSSFLQSPTPTSSQTHTPFSSLSSQPLSEPFSTTQSPSHSDELLSVSPDSLSSPALQYPLQSQGTDAPVTESLQSPYSPSTTAAEATTPITLASDAYLRESAIPQTQHPHHTTLHSLSSSIQPPTPITLPQTSVSISSTSPQPLSSESFSTTPPPSHSSELLSVSPNLISSPILKYLLHSQSTKPSPSESQQLSHSPPTHSQVSQRLEPTGLPRSSPHLQASQSPHSTAVSWSPTPSEPPQTSQLPTTSKPTLSSLVTEPVQTKTTEILELSTPAQSTETSEMLERLQPTRHPTTSEEPPSSEMTLTCDQLPQQDPCLNCTCQADGVWTCEATRCNDFPCPEQEIYIAEGECCPRCAGCEVEVGTQSRLYGDGERWSSPADPCVSCVCRRGVPVCEELLPDCRATSDQEERNHDSSTSSNNDDLCANVSCAGVKCPRGEEERLMPGVCCPICAPLSSRCLWWGDHVRTFDGLLLRRTPGCGHTLLTTHTRPVTTVTATLTDYLGNFLVKITVGDETLEVENRNERREKTKANVRFIIGNETVPYDPQLKSNFAVYVTGNNIFVVTVVGIQVVVGGKENGNDALLEVTVGEEHGGEVEGICGNLNTYPQDDLTLPSGDFIQDAAVFMEYWSMGHSCLTRSAALPCDISSFDLAEKMCSVLKSFMFRECHHAVPPEPYIRVCTAEVCQCQAQDTNCLCPTLRLYALLCARAGILLSWRHPNLCPVTCPHGMEWSECTAPCGSPTLVCQRTAQVSRSASSSHQKEPYPEVSNGVLPETPPESMVKIVDDLDTTNGNSVEESKMLVVTKGSKDNLVRSRKESSSSKFNLAKTGELCPGPCVVSCVCAPGRIWDGRSCVQEEECRNV
ncbi:uncharacterized protein LOC143038124 [Oratosquilla oratoria]|uniref:uncharacterized protein LOC143038124 n=1 Tax=Oratosquilla oratoria TaxID=337810 RepID=UPI003F767CDD